MKLTKLFTILACSAPLFFTSCGESKSTNNILTVGTEPTFPPFEMRDSETKEIVGFDIDLIKAIAKDQGLVVEIRNLGFDALIPALQSGNIDIAASGVSITDKRKKAILFSDPYINAGLAVAIKTSNTKFTSIVNIKGASVGVQIGSTGAAKANELKKQGVVSSIKVFDNVALAMMELTSGGVDIVINDAPVSEAYVNKHAGDLKLLPGLLQSDSYGFAFSKGNTSLQAKVNAGLKNVIANGTVKALKAKYFGK